MAALVLTRASPAVLPTTSSGPAGPPVTIKDRAAAPPFVIGYVGPHAPFAAWLVAQPGVTSLVKFSQFDVDGAPYDPQRTYLPPDTVLADVTRRVPLQSGAAQLLIVLHVFEHVLLADEALHELRRATAVGGWLQIEIPCNPLARSTTCPRALRLLRNSSDSATARVLSQYAPTQRKMGALALAARRSRADRKTFEMCSQADHVMVWNCSEFRAKVEASGWRCSSELEVLRRTPSELAVYGLGGAMVRGGDRNRILSRVEHGCPHPASQTGLCSRPSMIVRAKNGSTLRTQAHILAARLTPRQYICHAGYAENTHLLCQRT